MQKRPPETQWPFLSIKTAFALKGGFNLKKNAFAGTISTLAALFLNRFVLN